MHRPMATVSALKRRKNRAEVSVPCILAIGDLSYDTFAKTEGQAVVITDINGITEDLLATCLPDLVVSPLVGRGFDCFDVAERLIAAQFKGRYRAVVETLPDPSVVRREIRAHFPDLDFDILILS